MPNSVEKINSNEFYGEYHGHKVKHLKILLPKLREKTSTLIWTAGDSSLDNKYWFHASKEATSNGYAQVLDPPISNADVTYWLNKLSSDKENEIGAINTAVEATTLNQRTLKLCTQDLFLQEHIQSQDVLVVSIGGNDIALAPTPCTILSILSMICCIPSTILEKGCTCCSIPADDYLCGCSTSLLNCLGACPPCLGYFRHLFGSRIQTYLKKLTSKTKPRLILVCMIYYPDEYFSTSWANAALGALGYNSNPEKLQLLIRKTFEEAISKISIENTTVIPVPLFNVLDGKNSLDYVARVEPSPQGGKKMAEFLLDIIHNDQIAHVPPKRMPLNRG